MADYIFFHKSRNALSSFLHILLNILLGVSSILLTALTNSFFIGLLLIIISKWRVFAVRIRYLFLNIKANLLDFIIGISFVTLAYFAGSTITWLHITLALLYSIWLIIIKPLSSESGNLVQALTAVFLGTTAAITTTSTLFLNPVVIVALEFIIGYSASRHILIQNGDKSFTLYSLICGLLFSEIAWLCNAWTIAYNFSFLNISFFIPQLSIILTIFAFVLYKINYSLSKHDGKLSKKEITAPIFFGISVISILVILLSNTAF